MFEKKDSPVVLVLCWQGNVEKKRDWRRQNVLCKGEKKGRVSGKTRQRGQKKGGGKKKKKSALYHNGQDYSRTRKDATKTADYRAQNGKKKKQKSQELINPWGGEQENREQEKGTCPKGTNILEGKIRGRWEKNALKGGERNYLKRRGRKSPEPSTVKLAKREKWARPFSLSRGGETWRKWRQKGGESRETKGGGRKEKKKTDKNKKGIPNRPGYQLWGTC